MSLFQIAATLFALSMIYVVNVQWRKKVLSMTEFTTWMTIWLMFVVFAVFPNLLLDIAHRLRFSRVFDLLLVGALMILTVLVFLSYFSQKKNQQKLEQLVQSMAIAEANVPSKLRKKQ